MTELLSLMTLATAGLAFLALVVLFHRFHVFGCSVILGVYFVDSVFLGIPPVEIGGFNVTPLDAISVVVMAAGLSRLAFRRPNILHAIWAVFAIAGFLSFYEGYRLFDAKTPGVEFRPVFFLLAAVTYCSSFDLSAPALRGLKRAWYITAGALIVLAVYRWLALSFSLPELDSWSALEEASYGRIPRVLTASQTLFLLNGWLLTAPSLHGRRSSRIARASALLLLGFVLIMQHRTVWAAAVVCLILLFGRLGTLLHRPVWLTGAVAGAAVVLAFVSLDASSPIATSIRESISEPTQARSTFEWRVSGWQQLVLDDNGPGSVRDTLLGSHPFGAGLRRRVDGEVINYSAHNYYVDTFMRMGAVGLAALLFWYGTVLWKIRLARWTSSTLLQDWRVVMTSILVAQLVYFIGYGADYGQGVLLGVAMSLAGAKHNRAALPHAIERRCPVLYGKGGRLSSVRPSLRPLSDETL